MAEKPMHHFGMEGNTNGASSGQFVVTVGADGKVMQQATSTKSDVYQYVVNAAGGSGQYMGLMSMGSDGKLTSMRNDRNILPQEASSAAVIDFNSGKDPKTVLLQIHHAQPHIIHHGNPETHSLKPQQQLKHREEDHQHRNDHSSIPLQPSAVIDFNAKDPKAVLLQIHPSQSQLPHQSAQENQSTHHPQVSQQRLQQGNITQQQPQQLQTSLPDQQQQLQSHDHRHSMQQQHRRQSHQQVLRTDKIVKGDREVVCAKSCRACCKFDDDEETPDVNAYVQQSMKEGNPSPTTTVWASENSTTFSPGLNSTSPNGPSKAARFQCKVCLKMFTQKVNLTAHERIHFGERPYQCKTCLKSFTQQSNLVTHERIHTGERPYQCNVCMKRFTQRQNLTAHERIHLGERPFTCQVCQKSFTQSQNLTAHERIHLGERPFQCKVCLKTFTQQQNLNSHERIHHMERQFTCNVCLRSFIQESSLQRHMQTHTGERPYTCQVCHRSFAQQSSLLVHEWVHKTPDRRKRNFAFEAVEEHVLEISSEQGHPNTDGEQKRIDQEDINDDKGQVQCLT